MGHLVWHPIFKVARCKKSMKLLKNHRDIVFMNKPKPYTCMQEYFLLKIVKYIRFAKTTGQLELHKMRKLWVSNEADLWSNIRIRRVRIHSMIQVFLHNLERWFLFETPFVTLSKWIVRPNSRLHAELLICHEYFAVKYENIKFHNLLIPVEDPVVTLSMLQTFLFAGAGYDTWVNAAFISFYYQRPNAYSLRVLRDNLKINLWLFKRHFTAGENN